jgi:hypothetical protein
MKKFFWWLLKLMVKLIGLSADLIAIYGFIKNEEIEVWFLRISLEPILTDPILSGIVVEFGLIGTGVFLWDWLDKHVSTPFEGYKIYGIMLLSLSILLTTLFFRAFNFPLFDRYFFVFGGCSMIISWIISRALSRFMKMPKNEFYLRY